MLNIWKKSLGHIEGKQKSGMKKNVDIKKKIDMKKNVDSAKILKDSSGVTELDQAAERNG